MPHWPDLECISASLHKALNRAISRSTGCCCGAAGSPSNRMSPTGAYPSPSTSKCASWVTALTTIISLRVKVPVLSEQITDTEPSVSIAGNTRTIALRFAIDCTPTARVMVSTAGKPSGMAATDRPTTARNNSVKGCSRIQVPTSNSTTAMARIMPVIHFASTSICSTSGVVSFCTSDSKPPIRPISVVAPVAITTPMPCPAVTLVPLNARHSRSPSPASSDTALVCFSTGNDSPVSRLS